MQRNGFKDSQMQLEGEWFLYNRRVTLKLLMSSQLLLYHIVIKANKLKSQRNTSL